jgi:hypothetical protein
MPDLVIELRSEETPARPFARSGAAVCTGKGNNGMRMISVELN